MTTLVFQSFGTEGVSVWLERCMESVRSWASLRGFDYLRLDDSSLDRCRSRLRTATEGSTDPTEVVVERLLKTGGAEFQATV